METERGQQYDGAGQDLARDHGPLLHGGRRASEGNAEGGRRPHHPLGAPQDESAGNPALATNRSWRTAQSQLLHRITRSFASKTSTGTTTSARPASTLCEG